MEMRPDIQSNPKGRIGVALSYEWKSYLCTLGGIDDANIGPRCLHLWKPKIFIAFA